LNKALDVHSRLPSDSDYDSLKSALLRRYQLHVSEDGFKRKFRTARADIRYSHRHSLLLVWQAICNVG